MSDQTTRMLFLCMNIQYLHDETNILSIQTCELHASQIRQVLRHSMNSPHSLTSNTTPIQNEQTAFNNCKCTKHIKAHKNVALADKQTKHKTDTHYHNRYIPEHQDDKQANTTIITFNQYIRNTTNLSTTFQHSSAQNK